RQPHQPDDDPDLHPPSRRDPLPAGPGRRDGDRPPRDRRAVGPGLPPHAEAGPAVDPRMSVLSDAPAVIAKQQPAEVSRPRQGREIGFLLLFLVFTGYMLIPLLGVGLFSVATTWFDTVLPVGYTFDHVV